METYCTLHKELQCCKEDDNPHDPYTIAVIKGDTIVGHVPQRISAASYLFLEREENSVILANCGALPSCVLIVACGMSLCLCFFGKVIDNFLFLRCQQRE